jgi:hypothetical protein
MDAFRIGICAAASASTVEASSVGTFLWPGLTYMVVSRGIRSAVRPPGDPG